MRPFSWDAMCAPGLMLYQTYQTYADLALPFRAAARWTNAALSLPAADAFGGGAFRRAAAASELVARAGLTHRRPPFGIESIDIGGREVAVREREALVTPFATLLQFEKDGAPPQPPVLLVAPMSGHFATLLRATARTMLPEHDVYITDWHNARDVPVANGRFDLDDYIEHLILFLAALGPEAHVVAVCQPCVPALAAVALLAEGKRAAPRSLTLMAGPIDARSSPTKVNELATSRPIDWFERNLIGIVPPRFAGAWRRVYPGFLQLSAFVGMNLERHLKAQRDLYESVAAGDETRAESIRTFYDEYFAVADLPAEFYLQTVRSIFQEHDLPLGRMHWRGHRVDPRAIERTALLTVEGERDDVCGLGQTMAAHELCSGLRPSLKHHHLQAGVGHYGVFSGKRWQSEVYPVVRTTVASRTRVAA